MAILECYKQKEAAKILKIDEHLFKTLRESGLITGRKSGRSWIYDEEELNYLIRSARGFDLGSSESIREAAPIIITMYKTKG